MLSRVSALRVRNECFQYTSCPCISESEYWDVPLTGPSKTIKTHHNVGGLSANMKLKVIEPLRELFKDEVSCRHPVLGCICNPIDGNASG